LYSVAIPLLFASAAIPIPTIPTLSPGPLTSGIVASDAGVIYFVDSFHRTIWRVQPGRSAEAFVTGRNGRALSLDEDGNLYGTHEDASGAITVWRADCHGSVVDITRTDVPQYGHAFVVEDDGEVIASSGSSKRTGVRLVRAGETESELIAGGDMGFRDGAGVDARFFPIGGMTRTPDGELLVTSGATIRRVRADGSVNTVAKGERLLKPRHSFLARLFGDVQTHLTGIAVGRRGEIYVANSARNADIRINTDGSADEVMTSDGGWTPTGVATSKGSLYVLEYGRGVRVRRVDPNGVLSLVAQVRPERAVAAQPSLGRSLLPATIG
jgi:streptogramin lyase